MAYRVIRSSEPEQPLYERLQALTAGAERRGEPFLLGLSGGSTPEELYRRLAAPFAELKTLRLVEVDERRVPADDQDSNWRMISSLLAGPAGISPDRLLYVSPGESAAAYQRRLRQLLSETGKTGLDAAVLGLGEDGHTASVFPEEVTFHGEEAVYRSSSPRHRHERITLSLPFLAGSGLLCVLVKGEGKRAALEGMLAGNERLPAAHLPMEKTEIYTDLKHVRKS